MDQEIYLISLNNCILLVHREKDFLGAFYGMMDFIVKLQLELKDKLL